MSVLCMIRLAPSLAQAISFSMPVKKWMPAPMFAARALLMMVLMAAASYLAMRAVKSPRYMGRDVGSDEGWEELLAHFERIIDRIADDASPADAPTDNS